VSSAEVGAGQRAQRAALERRRGSQHVQREPSGECVGIASRERVGGEGRSLLDPGFRVVGRRIQREQCVLRRTVPRREEVGSALALDPVAQPAQRSTSRALGGSCCGAPEREEASAAQRVARAPLWCRQRPEQRDVVSQRLESQAQGALQYDPRVEVLAQRGRLGGCRGDLRHVESAVLDRAILELEAGPGVARDRERAGGISLEVIDAFPEAQRDVTTAGTALVRVDVDVLDARIGSRERGRRGTHRGDEDEPRANGGEPEQGGGPFSAARVPRCAGRRAGPRHRRRPAR